ncbi:hypothetical protein EJ08DRAFT_694730 [Tothia fuscella]|uniref:Uncharacterized protein n=1 Tax=Tothia fuscella TaxID=1048955 RepID=A0A9P4NXL8_9PEZI|nr:hypothetical protein EJ08DRAFT_694730 [Tothia fuscella]
MAYNNNINVLRNRAPKTTGLVPPPRPIARFEGLTGFPYYHDKPLPSLPPIYKRSCEFAPAELHSVQLETNSPFVGRSVGGPIAELDGTPISAVAPSPVYESVHELDCTPIKRKKHARIVSTIFELDADSEAIPELDGASTNVGNLLSRLDCRFSTGRGNMPFTPPAPSPEQQSFEEQHAPTSPTLVDSDSDSEIDFAAIAEVERLARELPTELPTVLIQFPSSVFSVDCCPPNPPNTPATPAVSFKIKRKPVPGPPPLVMPSRPHKSFTAAEEDTIESRRKARCLSWAARDAKDWSGMAKPNINSAIEQVRNVFDEVPAQVIPNAILLSKGMGQHWRLHHEFFLVPPTQCRKIYAFLRTQPAMEGWKSLNFHALFVEYCTHIATTSIRHNVQPFDGTQTTVLAMLRSSTTDADMYIHALRAVHGLYSRSGALSDQIFTYRTTREDYQWKAWSSLARIAEGGILELTVLLEALPTMDEVNVAALLDSMSGMRIGGTEASTSRHGDRLELVREEYIVDGVTIGMSDIESGMD